MRFRGFIHGMQPLPVLTKANIGAALALVVLILGALHINISDAAPAIAEALTGTSNGNVALIALLLFVYGHFQTRGQLVDALNQIETLSGALNETTESTGSPVAPSTSSAPTSSLAKTSGAAAVALVVLATLGLSGCAISSAPVAGGGLADGSIQTSTQTGPALPPSAGLKPLTAAQLTTIGYEAENFLQRSNAGVSAAAPGVESFLADTHNPKDAQTVALYSSLASLFSSTAQAGLAAGLPPQQVQAATNVNALAPAIVPGVVNNVIATTPTVGSNPTN
jgi:hypothetical protein